MSKKKLLLASAVFAVGSMLTACGGGDDGAAPSAGGGTGGGEGGGDTTPAPAPATTIKKVLATALVAGSGIAGANIKYVVFELKDDGTFDKSFVANDANFDTPMYGIYEFGNGNDLLQDTSGNLYVYDEASNQIKAVSGINFAADLGSYGINGFTQTRAKYVQTATLKYIFQNGEVVSFANVFFQTNDYIFGLDANNDFVIVNASDGSKTTIMSGVTASSTPTTGSSQIVKLTNPSGTKTYLMTREGTAVELPSVLNPIIGSGADDAQVVKAGADYYILVKDDGGTNNMYYMKVSGNTVTYDSATVSIPIDSSKCGNLTADEDVACDASLDDSGNLFTVFEPNDGNGTEDYKPRVYVDPGNYGIAYEPTATYGGPGSVPSMEFLGDGLAAYLDPVTGDILVTDSSATVNTPGVPVAFNNFITCWRNAATRKMRSGNTAICVNNVAGNNNDTVYSMVLSASSVTINSQTGLGETGSLGAITYATLSDGVYWGDGAANPNIYRCVVSETDPCTKLSNLKGNDINGTNYDIVQAMRVPTFIIDPVIVGVAPPTTAGACTTYSTSGAVVINLSNDSKTSIPVPLTLNCLPAPATDTDTVALKHSLNVDAENAAISYGTNPALNAVCPVAAGGPGGFDKLNLRLADGSVYSYSVVDDGMCLLGVLGYVRQ